MGTDATERAAARPLAYAVTGSGPPLILLHGLSGSGRWWSRNIAAFSARFRTFTVDLPGFGESRTVRWSRLDDIADRIATWMSEEGLPHASIAGHSLGGAVAARLASRHPGRIDRLVLVGAAIRPRGTRGSARAGNVLRSVGRRSPGIAPLLARDLLRCHPGSVVAAAIDALHTDWDPHLPRITAPTLVVWGEHDPITPVAAGHFIASTIPNARLLTVANTGHSPMWEDAETFNVEVLRFLLGEDRATVS